MPLIPTERTTELTRHSPPGNVLGGLADDAAFFEAEISLPITHKLADDQVIQELDLKNLGGLRDSAG